MNAADTAATRLATRLAFFAAGFATACWTPLVPYVQARLGVDARVLGLLLLCLGAGSVLAMWLTGSLAARWGSRRVILLAGAGVVLTLPPLVLAATPVLLGLGLLLFGAALGSLDVAMNLHAVEVERGAARPLMSGFHALFSIGEVAGAAAMTLLLAAGTSAFASVLLCGLLLAAVIALAGPRLLPAGSRLPTPQSRHGWPHGEVRLLALLTAVIFLVEGAVLDWGALRLVGAGLLPAAQGGLACIVFTGAMTAGRLGGDAATGRFGDRAVLACSGAVAMAGLFTVALATVATMALAGFALVGVGVSNIVPVLFRRAGTQAAMPAGLALATVTMTGYAGLLIGPAIIGLLAQAWGLSVAFGLLALLVGLIPVCAAAPGVALAGKS